MAIRPNAESRLISSLVNVQDVDQATRFGIMPEMFASYGAEYRWLITYPSTFGGQPSAESLRTKFPDLPYSPDYTDVGFICSEVRQQHDKRQLVKMSKDFVNALYQDDVEAAYAILQSVSLPGQTLSYELRNTLHDFSILDGWDDPVEKISAPWETLQRATGGFADGDLVYLAARPGQGKSWSLAACVVQALLEGKKVLLFSLEMPQKAVRTRIDTMLARVLGFKDVRHTDLKGRSYDAIAYRSLLTEIKEKITGELFIVDTSKGAISPSTVATLSKGMDLVLIDYVGLMASPLGGRAVDDWRTMAAISNILKEVAVQNEVPIIAAAQINRDGDTTGYLPPKLKNLSQSDALGQDADIAITMKRRSKTVAIYSLEKNRDGDGGALWHAKYLPNEGDLREIGADAAKEMMIRDEDKVRDFE